MAKQTGLTLPIQISHEKIRKIWTDAFKKEGLPEKIYFKEYLIGSLIINLIVIVVVGVLIYFKKIPPLVPLFYGSPEGPEQLAQSWQLVVPSVLSIALIGLNSLVAIATKDDYLRKIIIFATVAITILSIVTTAKIIFLVGNF